MSLATPSARTSRASGGEMLALTAALLSVVISFLPYWASMELASNDLVSYAGPTRFSIWDAYPIAVMLGVAICAAIFALGVVRVITGKRTIRPSVLYVGGGVVVTLLFVYGLIEGPSRLLADPLHQPARFGDGPVSFAPQRGPLLYAGLVLAVAIVVGGVADYRQPGDVEAS